jgi:hypothetical protein
MSERDEEQERAIMARTTKPPPAIELEAFCATCPPAEEVSALLTSLGLTPTFQMEARDDLKTLVHLPALPAQYHYKDACVMYNQKSTPFDPFGETASRAGSAV